MLTQCVSNLDRQKNESTRYRTNVQLFRCVIPGSRMDRAIFAKQR